MFSYVRSFIAVTARHQPEKYLILFSRLENPPSTLFSSSIEFSTMEVILLYSASIAMSHSGAANCRLYSQSGVSQSRPAQSPPTRRGSVRNCWRVSATSDNLTQASQPASQVEWKIKLCRHWRWRMEATITGRKTVLSSKLIISDPSFVRVFLVLLLR